MTTEAYRILMSPPDVGPSERQRLLAAFDSNWIAPAGPELDAFERELAERVGVANAVALSSGTAALHLALLTVGVQPGTEVLMPTLTFAATANAATYLGARPVFIDVDRATWQLDPELLVHELHALARRGRTPSAVVTVDLYGQSADHEVIADTCAEFDVPVVDDAAEALGATYRGRAVGTFGRCAVFSFNGNKIITTSSGGMLVTDDDALAHQVRHLATQARDPAPHYQHSTIGFNYRMSNLLAALGRAQLEQLDAKVARRRQINAHYRRLLDVPGLAFMPHAAYGEPNDWLTPILVDAEVFGADRDEVRDHLAANGIEARPVWKPMHLQPVFATARRRGGEVAAELFRRGLCLPSGSRLHDDEVDEIAQVILQTASPRRGRGAQGATLTVT